MRHSNTIIIVRRDSTTTNLMESMDLTAISSNGTELHCEQGALLGPLGLFVQGLLAFIAFGALIVKRFCEPSHERRSWKIWFFDTSKQGLGAALIHFANVFLAGMFTGDPCTWYFVSFMLDSTVGIFIIYLGLKVSQLIAVKRGWKFLLVGEYGRPPSARAWLAQCLAYLIVMLVEKVLMTLLVLFNFWKRVREFILSPITNPKLELVLVMFVIPFIVNALIFWVVDNFLKKKVGLKPSPVAAGHHDNTSVKYTRRVGVGTDHYYTRVTNDQEADVLLGSDSVAHSNGGFARTDSAELVSDSDHSYHGGGDVDPLRSNGPRGYISQVAM